MKNKLLVGGSAIAVVILVLASLSPVVGVHTVKSNSAISSPLFNVRTKRAIGAKEDGLICKYVGKGKLMPFPMRDKRRVLFQKIVDSISTMSEAEFDRFIKFVIKHLQKDDKIKDENIPEVLNELHQLRTNPQAFKVFSDSRNDYDATSGYDISACPWFPGCFILLILNIIFVFPLVIFGIISSLVSCWPKCTTEDCR